MAEKIDMDLDTLDAVSTKLKQLNALLMMTFGEAQDAFDSMNEGMRGNFMWVCHDMVEDCQGLLKMARKMEARNG